MDLIKIKDIYSSPSYNSKIVIAGWVRAFRGNRFIELNDGSTIKNIQCVISDSDKENEIYKNVLPPLSILNQSDQKNLIEALKNLNFTNKPPLAA